jgi:UDP-N-acetylmuramoyl-L-alanyl-D-glutamate--2,6-diaminopimelate ligase
MGFLRKIIPQNCCIRRWYSIGNGYLAALVYGHPAKRMTCIGVTGTDGKTTTTELIAHILRRSGKRVLSISTTRVQMDRQLFPTDKRTTPSPWKIQKLLHEAVENNIDCMVMEVSSHALAQARVQGILFDIAAFTNITPEHLDYHVTFVNYQLAKKKLFTTYLKPERGISILNSEDGCARAWSREFHKKGKKILTYSTKPHEEHFSSWNADDIESTETGIRFDLTDHQRKTKQTVQLPMRGFFNVPNTIAAMQTAYCLGIDMKDSARFLEDFSGIPGRMEEISLGQDFYVFVDFAVTPGAFAKLLNTAKKIAGGNQSIIVLGSPGSHPDPGVRHQIGVIVATVADQIIVTDDEPYFENPAHIRTQILDGAHEAIPNEQDFENRVQDISDRRLAIKTAISLAQSGDVVIVAGMGHLQSRNIAGEEVQWSDVEIVREALKTSNHSGIHFE